MKLTLLIAILVGLATDLSSGAVRVSAVEMPPQTQLRERATHSETAYTLGAGDRIRIDVFQVPEYSGENSVLVDGTLNLPLVGSVDVQGLTLDQAATAISARYVRILRRPLVTVSLVTARPLEIGIAGEINRPGAYTIPHDGTQSPTLIQILETAGGIRQSADLRNIQVRRPQRSGIDQVINVDLWQFLQTGDLRYNLTLRDGDTILVPTATTIDLAESSQIATASFSPESITVNVVGEVKNPGSIQLPPNTPLNQAILTAGGFNTRARSGAVDLIRLNPNGTVTRQKVEVNFSEGVNADMNPPLRPNDTIVVGRSGLAHIGDSVGNVLSPIRAVFSIFNLFGL